MTDTTRNIPPGARVVVRTGAGKEWRFVVRPHPDEDAVLAARDANDVGHYVYPDDIVSWHMPEAYVAERDVAAWIARQHERAMSRKQCAKCRQKLYPEAFPGGGSLCRHCHAAIHERDA